MDFICGFPGVASQFGTEANVYDGVPRPGAGDERAEARAECDRVNKLALKFYVSGRVDSVVTNGTDIMARQFYER